ncbi:hypothetical protein J7337_006282 [Fusarium musae]|uniref:Uncharacterized protein n=1 Tax=Fusarium musae TaxID=1042133 RepID=A0A9P8IRY7_9HYPO|nr:hypothetical protein J7337_006282 [Fusarium musae]KAG9503437.1 hypothetical protein J7337_006282 [Fusarium musae]
MPPLTVHSHLFPRESVQLGRLVTTIKSPQNSYYPAGKQQFQEGDIYSVVNKDFYDLRQKNKDSKLQAVLTSVASLLFQTEEHLDTKIQDTICLTYFLDNADTKFREMCKDKVAREWFEDAFKKRRHVYMVTAIQTLIDAKMSLDSGTTGAVEAEVKIPVSKVLGEPTGAATLDPKLVAQYREKKHRETGFVGQGEQIYAIQYRKVKWQLFSSRDMEMSFLEEGNRWQVMWKTMGAEKSTRDVLETTLEDDETPPDQKSGVSACEVEGYGTIYYV